MTGIAFTLYSSQANASLQLAVTDQMRGRVLGIYGYVFFGTAPLGGLLAGWLAQEGGTQLAFLVAGLVGVGGHHLRVGRHRTRRTRRVAADRPGGIARAASLILS